MTCNNPFLIFVLALSALAWARDFVPSISWKGKGGKVLPPQIEIREEGGRQLVHCSPVETEPWQGAIGELDEPVNLSGYRGVAFDFRQGFYPGNPAVVFYITTKEGAIYADFSGGRKDWVHVEIPFDRRLWKGADKHGFGMTKSFSVYPYQLLDSPAKFLEIANVRLLDKDGKPEENRDISVRSYQLDTKPDDGEIASQCLLISGNTSDLVWRGYGQCEPSITFDLGTIYAVTEMQIFASGEQHQQNFRNATVLASLDGKTFHPAGVINGSTLENGRQIYRLDAPFAARHVRLLPIRLRQDFPVRIAEVKFRGHIPDSDELARLSERSYDLGRPLPKDTGNNYLPVDNGAISFRVCRENGVLCDLRWKGRLVALQQFVRYNLMRRKSGTSADSFDARVSAVEEIPGGVRVTTAIPAMPGLSFVQDFAVEENGVRTTVTVKEIERIEPAILRISHETILAQEFRKGGFYESWGAHHRLTRTAAAEVVTEQSIDGVASLTFETAGGTTTLLQTILAHDGRFLPIGSTVEESATQFFLPNGLRMCNGLMNIGRDATPHSMTSLLQLNDGSLLQAYDLYLNRQECREFWGKLHRASWLRDVKLVVSMGGWEGGWKGGHARAVANLNRMYEFDP
ncbi:MAG: discoidin domain-containing protein, partial [Victivallales bacterium]|nr:discoidin domain-containing protein [Victivallales bacterium]